jgi:DNA mismatch repair protein MSH4
MDVLKTLGLKGGVGALNARVFAVKVCINATTVLCYTHAPSRAPQANCNRLLDVARETYKENVGDIYQLSRVLSEQHNLPVVLVYQDGGFVFTLKKDELEGGLKSLPRGFVHLTAQKGKWRFSSMELASPLSFLLSHVELR